jgi:predicted extracellular nuclease
LVNTGNAVFLDEYSPSGTLVQSLPLLTANSGSNKSLILSGTATSEGLLALSADGQYLTLAGYNASPGGSVSLSGTTGAAVNRVVAKVGADGTIDTTTALTDFASGNNPRSVVSSNGNDFWVAGGAGGVRYTTLGSTTSTDLSSTSASGSFSNVRALNIFGGQLYASSGSGTNTFKGVETVGTGLPTSGAQTITRLPGLTDTTNPSNYSFYLADLSSAVPGVDTLYVADDGAGALTKFSLVGSNWVSNGTIGTSTDSYRGLTGKVNGTSVNLFATREGGSGATGGGELVSLTDTGGYNGAFSGTPTVIATASANTAFRGVAFAPQNGTTAPSITTQPANQTINSGESANLTVVATGTTPLNYQWYQGNTGDTSTPVGSNSASFTTPTLTTTTSYWVRVSNSVGTADSNTATVTVNTTPVAPSITTQPASQTIASGATATLNVVATGTAPLSYQWYQGNSGDTTNLISGATSSSFTTPTLSTTTSYWVQVSNTAGSVNSNTATITVTAQVFIHDIQGKAHISPFVTTVNDNRTSPGATVTNVPGIVTGIASNGFYMQDPNPDNDPATSEGIFVFTGANGSKPIVGDSVKVTGVVTEFRSGCTSNSCTSTSSAWNNLTTTELSSANGVTLSWNLVSSGNSLPAPVVVGAGGRIPPTQVIEDDTNGSVETGGNTFDPATDGIDFWESLEGMRIQLNNAVAVGPTSQFGSTTPLSCTTSGDNCEIPVIPDNGAGASLRTARGGVLIAPNSFNPERIILNNVLNSSVPSPMPTVKVGDKFPGAIVGILDYNFDNYKLLPSEPLPAVVSGGTSRETLSFPTRGATQLDVATFNVENLAPSDPQSKFDQLALTVVNNLKSPDIISVEEIQDNSGATDNGVVDADQTLAKLITAIANAGGPTYVYRQINPVNDQDGGQPGGNIRQGFLFRTDRGLSFVDRPGGDSTTANSVINVNGVPQLQYSPGRIDPNNATAFTSSRKPLAGEFTFNGRTLFVIANHFNSKGGDQPLFGRFQPPVLSSEVQRVQQATVVANFVSQILAINPNADIVVAGDLNDFEFSNPVNILKNVGLKDMIETLPANERYSYVFEGNSQVLDHIMVSAHLLSNSGAQFDVVHVNSEYSTLDPLRTSDHDPGVVRLTFVNGPQANPDAYDARSGAPLNVDAANGILANDTGGPLQIVTNTNPAHGTLTLNSDGSFTYTPQVGYTGSDSFSYTIGNAAQLYKTNLPPMATIGGVPITAGGYGSSLYPVPGSSDEYYGLTDRGPNVDGPNGSKVEPIPTFVPAIGKFKLVNGQAILEGEPIQLKAADGTPYSGRVSTEATTGETITDLNGNVLSPDLNGYDPEGLVALADGTFWVSDEYGPYITHFDATGKQIERLSPFNGSLPAELAKRIPNRGMEGLTITPDGSTLVGIMQSALQQSDLAGYDAKKITILRIITYNIASHEIHEYLTLLDNPNSTKTAVSEITALSNTTFLVDERDGNFPPGSYKKLWKIDISGATDVGPGSTVSGATYNAANGGLLIGGKTLELLVKGLDTIPSATALQNVGITPASRSLYLDLVGVLTALDPQGRFFSHDKVEGVAILNGGTKIVLANDSDFGIDGLTNSAPPFQLHAKVSPTTGKQDDGEFLVIDLSQLPAATSSTTVTFNVLPAQVAKLKLTNVPASVTAGVPFDVTVTAYDSFGNVAGNSKVSVQFSSSDNQATLPGGTIETTDNGVHTFSGLVLKTAGDQTLSATGLLADSTQVQSDPVSITVNPAAVANLQLTAPSAATVDSPVDLTVTAKDAYGNTVTGYTGTVHFTSSDSKAILPADYSFTASDNGVHAFTSGVTFKTAGAQSITVSDGQLTVTQNNIQVNPGQATITLSNLSAVYDGTPKYATATTKPDGLKVNITYKQGNTTVAAPTEAGSYDVTATIDDPNYTGSQTGTLVIDKAGTSTLLTSSINLSLVGQAVTFFAQVSITPPGGGKLVGTVTFLIDGVAQPAVTLDSNGNASFTPASLSTGNHTIVAKYDGTGNFQSSTDTLIQTVSTTAPSIKLAVQTVKGIYGGTVNLAATLTSNGKAVGGKTISFTLNGNPVCGGTGLPACSVTDATGKATLQNISLPTSIYPGTYSVGVGARVVGEATSGSASLTVTQAPATVTLSNLIQTYDGTSKYATATTNPAGLNVVITYKQGSTVFNSPTNAGNYSVTATINDPRYTGKATGTLVITKANATIILDNLTQTYDGKPKYVTATTNPAGLKVTIKYSQNGTAVSSPTKAGSYDVLATVNDANYTGTQTAVLVIQPGTPTVKTGGVKNLKATSATLTGTVNANFANITSIYFEWGVPFDSQVHTLPVNTQVTGNSTITVSADLTGLQPDTSYYFRLVVTYGSGSQVRSDVVTSFHTPKK